MLYVGDDEEGDGVVAVSKSGGRKREADLEMVSFGWVWELVIKFKKIRRIEIIN